MAHAITASDGVATARGIIVENGARIDTAGSLLGGRIVWFAALLTGFEAAGEKHEDYLVISHGHDGSRAVTVRRTFSSAIMAARAFGIIPPEIVLSLIRSFRSAAIVAITPSVYSPMS